jgi:hypothetical protein
MKRIVWIFLFVAVWAGTGNAQKTTKPVPVFVIHQPTIIAFYPHYTQDELDKGEGDAAAMDDFSFYAYKADKRLHKAEIDFRFVEARSFKVRVETKVHYFQGGKIDIGYYFIAPGKEPHVEYGVMTDEDLFDAARKYFKIAIR